MTRLIMALLFLALATLAVQGVGSLLRNGLNLGRDPAPEPRRLPSEEARLPKSFSNIAYALLIVLMYGVTTGWLGGG